MRLMPLAARRLMPLAVTAVALLTTSTAHATATPQEVEAAKHAGVGYLKSVQQANGEFHGFGREWALTALAAAGEPAANVKQAGGTDARTFYRDLVGEPASWPGVSEPQVGDFDVATLSAYAGGIDPARVSSTQNLIAQITARYQTATPGYYGEPGLFTNTVFALLALADAKTRGGVTRVPRALLSESVSVVRANQHTDGGWTFARAEGSPTALKAPGEAETTGAAMASLCNAGVPASDPTLVAAKNFLVADLKAEASGNGAFATEFGPNTDSNAWAVQGLNACGVAAQSAEFTTAKGKTPIDFLLSEQLAGGGFRVEPSETSANLYSTQDAVRALAGAGFTAAPPKPKGARQWVFEKRFTAGKSTRLALIINDGAAAPRACAVTLTPTGATTTLARVLEAAESASQPAKCVGEFTPASGGGAITSIDGLPKPPQAKWNMSVDGGGEALAKRSKKVHLGDTIYLRLL
jgi:hypothetical protein